MPVSDLSIYSHAQATGVLASAFFVGGNIIVSGSMMPNLRSLEPLDRIKNFDGNFNTCAKIMVSIGLAAGTAFSTAAYYAPTVRLRNSMIASAALALGILPFTRVAIIPTVMAIKDINKTKDSVKASAVGQDLLDKWQSLNIVRAVIMLAACLNGLKELTDGAL